MTSPSPRLLFTAEASGGARIRVVPDQGPVGRHRAGPLSLVPAGTPVTLSGKARHFRQLVLTFDRAMLILRHREIDPAAVFQPRFMFADATVVRLCELLADECLQRSPLGASFGDSLVHALLLALPATPVEGCLATGGLATWQLRQLEDFVQARLGDELSLDHLSEAVGVSRSHFGRAFKQATGQSPFEWLRAKRIERAKEMLVQGEMPVAEIAIATGFADQAHLTRVFGRAVGVPPGLWQRTRRHARGERPGPVLAVG
jgi:AraC-like DNA-binding protein